MCTTSAPPSTRRWRSSPRCRVSTLPASRSGHSAPSPARASQLQRQASLPSLVSFRKLTTASVQANRELLVRGEHLPSPDLGNQHSPALDSTVMEVGDRPVDLVQRVEDGG